MTKKSKSEPSNKAALRLRDFITSREPKPEIPTQKNKSKSKRTSKSKDKKNL